MAKETRDAGTTQFLPQEGGHVVMTQRPGAMVVARETRFAEEPFEKAMPKLTGKEGVDALVQRAKEAQGAYLELNQEQVDRISRAMALAGQGARVRLATLAIEETGRGEVEGARSTSGIRWGCASAQCIIGFLCSKEAFLW